MASWKEINRVKKSPADTRSIAMILLRLNSPDMTEWEASFLESLLENPTEELTTRQVEKLLEIRDDLTFLDQTREGFSVAILLENIYLGRLDLAEEDEEWITKVRRRSRTSIARKNLGRLIRLARELSLVERESETT